MEKNATKNLHVILTKNIHHDFFVKCCDDNIKPSEKVRAMISDYLRGENFS